MKIRALLQKDIADMEVDGWMEETNKQAVVATLNKLSLGGFHLFKYKLQTVSLFKYYISSRIHQEPETALIKHFANPLKPHSGLKQSV